MSSEWALKTIGEFCPFKYGKGLPERDRKPGVYSVISSAGLVGTHDAAYVNSPGVVIGRKGTVGSVTYSAEPFWPIDTAFYVEDQPSIRDIRFTYYLLKTLDLHLMNTDSAVPGLNRDNAHALEARIPSLDVQKNIANFLQHIDDRITLLRETNTTLEAIAQALFKSWFVDFDPVHAKMQGRAPDGMDEATAALFPDSFEESELGAVPKGWKWMPLNDAYEINPTRKLKKGETAPYLDMAGAQTQGHSVSGVIQREMGSGTKFMNGDTLLARITPCLENGKTVFVDFLPADQTGWGSTEFVVLRPKAPLPEYHAYLLARHPAFREHAIRSMSGTSGRQRIQNDVLSQFHIALPNEPVAKAFSELVMTIQQSIREGHEQATTLSDLRDTLLPRLISGQLRLPEAQAIAESA
jgi:type I restriction enzyme S subunit